MIFFLYNAFPCICCGCIIQLFISLLATIISFSSGVNYTFDYLTMLITTRSMMKRGLQPPPGGSVGLLTCPTCCTEGTSTNTSYLASPIILPTSVNSLPELIDQCSSSSSSLEGSSSSVTSANSLITALDNFEIFEFQNFEISTSATMSNFSHNLEPLQVIEMESDNVVSANVAVKNDGGSSHQEDILQLLHLILNQMMNNYQDLQTKIAQSELKFSTELQKISQSNDIFKQEMRSEIQKINDTLTPSLSTSTPTVVQLNNTPVAISSTSIPAVSNQVPSSVVSNQDFQTQMMTLLTTTFSKLTTVINSKSSDMKSELPKFSGDMKKFKSWQLAILAQLTLSPWSELYDAMTNNLIQITSNSQLKEKLYAKLLLCLEGQVFQDMVSRKHLCANGLLLFRELTQTYRPSHVPEVIASKIAEFWGTLKRQNHESMDSYYNRFHSLLDDLEDAGEAIPTKTAIRQFIFTLGSDFIQILNNFRIGLFPMNGQRRFGPVCWFFVAIMLILFIHRE